MANRNCLRPIRMWIDGKCYNIHKFDKKKYDTITCSVKETDDKKDMPYSTKIVLPSTYFSQIARFRMIEVDAIQNETNTIIEIPRNKKEDFLKISGHSEESIENAKEKMHSVIASVRQQIPALQFISIPVLSDEIKKNFEKFKEAVLKENYQGVEESIFQSALKLHLTVVVFSLLNDQEKQQALDVLEKCRSIISKNETPLKIRINGLKCMNNNYSKVNVLYAEASFPENTDSEKSLQEIANSISDLFYERGLCKENKDHVKLHMTIMNTKYRNTKEGTPKKRWVKRETFDATKIMERYKDYYFGEAIFDTIHLSLMSSKGEDGFYESLGTVHI